MIENCEEILELIEGMLQRNVDYWKKSEDDFAEYYIDAYQCVQINIKTILQTLASKVKEDV